MATNLEERQREQRQKVGAHEIKSVYVWFISGIFR